jgi:predicted deacylase
MIVSGTHGVEGYAGSACQTNLLRTTPHALTLSVRIVLVHAINPYGFAHDRRTTEDNIDLNRNFIDFSQPPPLNEHYTEYARQFLPCSEDHASFQAAQARLETEAERRGGYQAVKKALQPGQYLDPFGLYYGGKEPCWSNTVFRRICHDHLAPARRAAVLDIHTGLGGNGVGEFIFMTPDLFNKWADLLPTPTSCAGVQASVSAGVQGSLVNAALRTASDATIIGGALEFGTVSTRENTRSMILENWAHRFLAPNDPLRQESSQQLKATYFCDTDSWKQSVLQRFREVTERLCDFLVSDQS